jgi:hypothetical protein
MKYAGEMGSVAMTYVDTKFHKDWSRHSNVNWGIQRCTDSTGILHIHFLSLWGASCCVTYIYYINIQHKNYTYVIRKRNLTTFLLFQNPTTCFGPYGPSSGDIFEDFLLYCNTSIIFTSVRLSIAS